MKSFVIGLSLLCATSVFADTFTWTGAEDCYWTNAANWSVGGATATRCPGYMLWPQPDKTVITNDFRGDFVQFGAISTANTTINMAGRPVITKITFITGAPAYTIGTEDSDAQVLSFPKSTTGGDYGQYAYIVVNSDVTNDQHIRAIGRGRCGIIVNQGSTSCTLYLGSLRSGPHASWGSNHFYIQNSPGNVVYDGKVESDLSGNFTVTKAGHLTWNERGTGSGARLGTWQFNDVDGSELDLFMGPGTYVNTACGGGAVASHLIFYCNAHLHGGGLVLVNHWYNENYHKGDGGCIYVGSTYTARIDNGVAPHPSWTTCNNFQLNGYGTVQLNSSNLVNGITTIYGNIVVEAKKLGSKDCTAEETSISRNGNIVFSNYFDTWGKAPSRHPSGTIAYSGDAAVSCDRDILITNTYSKVASPRLSNRGGGKLTWSGNIMQTADTQGADFYLEAKTADLELTGAFQADKNWNLIIEGADAHEVSMVPQPAIAGKVIVTNGVLVVGSGTFPNASLFEIGGGAIKATNDMTIANLKLTCDSSLVVPEGVTLTISALERTSGKKLVVTRQGTGKLKISGLTAGQSDWITVNGYEAKVLEDGSVYESHASWKTAASGNWSASANWSLGMVPGLYDLIEILAAGPSYAVTFANDDEGNYKNIEIGNSAADSTATLSFAATNQVFDTGSKIVVGNGGEIGTSAADANLIFRGTSLMEIRDGGAWRASVGTNHWKGAGPYLRLAGGTIEMDGNAVLFATNCTYGVGKRLTLSNGVFRLKGNAVLNMTGIPSAPQIDLVPGEGKEMHAYFSEYARVQNIQDHGMICVGNNSKGRAYLEINLNGTRSLATPENINTISALRIGTTDGYGEFNMKSGKFHYSNSGFRVGCVEGSSKWDVTAAAGHYWPTGVVNQTGGTVDGSSAMAAYSSLIHGFEIGSATYVIQANRLFRGFYNLSGGTLDAGGLPLIGSGVRGEGDFVQTGGYANFGNWYTHGKDSYSHPLIIGYIGGKGRVYLSGGTLNFYTSCFVGGAKKEDVGLWNKPNHSNPDSVPNLDGSLGRGYGLLSVSGGTLTAKNDIVVGTDGTGVVHVAGGSISCKNLILSNDCASVLSFALSNSGAAPWTLKATEAIKIYTDAKLKVDATAATTIASSWVKLAETGSFVGEFGADDIEFVTDGAPAEVVRRVSAAEVRYSRGTETGLYLKLAGAGSIILLK